MVPGYPPLKNKSSALPKKTGYNPPNLYGTILIPKAKIPLPLWYTILISEERKDNGEIVK